MAEDSPPNSVLRPSRRGRPSWFIPRPLGCCPTKRLAPEDIARKSPTARRTGSIYFFCRPVFSGGRSSGTGRLAAQSTILRLSQSAPTKGRSFWEDISHACERRAGFGSRSRFSIKHVVKRNLKAHRVMQIKAIHADHTFAAIYRCH